LFATSSVKRVLLPVSDPMSGIIVRVDANGKVIVKRLLLLPGDDKKTLQLSRYPLLIVGFFVLNAIQISAQ